MAAKKAKVQEIAGASISMRMAQNWGCRIKINKPSLTATVSYVFPSPLAPAETVPLHDNQAGEVWVKITLHPRGKKRSVVVGNVHK